MNRNPQTGALEPFDFEHLLLNVPELKQFDIQIDTLTIDDDMSSNFVSRSEGILLVLFFLAKLQEFPVAVVLVKDLFKHDGKGAGCLFGKISGEILPHRQRLAVREFYAHVVPVDMDDGDIFFRFLLS